MQANDVEFSTASGDSSERMQARRKRMEVRHAAKTEEGGTKGTAEADITEPSRGKQQIANSLALLDHQKAKSIEHVTSIRVEADNLENDRRIEEENKRQDRLWRLQEEAVASGKANAAVEMRWNDLMEHNMPQDLNREIMKQKSACARIIASKDSLIKEFQAELKAKDEEYVKALKRQADDIEELLSRMDNQYKTLHKSYRAELDTIEDEFKSERAELLSNCKGEVDSLFDRRRKAELQFLEAKQEREEKYQTELEAMQAKDAEDYNKLKIKLETDIQTLEQQLEAMRATYLLNTEKLEYNYRVLTERDNENSATVNQQKRKLARLKDALSVLMTKYAQSDKQYKHQNAELTEEYRRITKQYKDLQHKFRHFEASDNRKYQEVWAMHEQEMSGMVAHLLKADRVVNEQLLGWEWHPPSTDVLGGKDGDDGAGEGDGASFGAGTDGGVDAGGAGAGAGGGAGAGAGGGRPMSAGSSVEDGEGGPGEEADHIAAAVDAKKAAERNEKVRIMLDLLIREAGFLIDSKVRKACESLSPEEAAVLQADAVLKALNITTEADVSQLLQFFFQPDQDLLTGDVAGVSSSLDGPDSAPKLKVAPEHVVRTVRLFIEERDAQRQEAAAAGGIHRINADDIGNKTGGSRRPDSSGAGRLGMTRGSVASVDSDRARSRREEREFWQRMADVIPQKTVRVWTALERSLREYNKTLEERASMVDEVESLRNQNQELKNVLNHYLNAQVNDELHVPPTQVIRIEPAAGASVTR